MIDVGCGPGALTAGLSDGQLGANAVAAVDPSEQFVEAAHARHPGRRVRCSSRRRRTCPSGTTNSDAALAQLVVHFMADPVGGLAEMRPGHPTRRRRHAASVWDVGGGRAPISPYWKAARELDPEPSPASRNAPADGTADTSRSRSRQPGSARSSKLSLSATTEYEPFDEWWHPYTLVASAPAGAHAQPLSPGGAGRGSRTPPTQLAA